MRSLPIAAVLLLVFAIPAAAAELAPLPGQPDGVPWPTERWLEGELPAELDRAAFERDVEAIFARRGRGGLRDTRALVIVRGGRLVVERYAEGFDSSMRFQSWSMAKSVTNALAGIAVREGALALDAPPPVPAWSSVGDPRSAITLAHLLHMESGLDNGDGFGNDAFVGRLLFGEGSRRPAAYAAEVPLVHEPGTHWAYSTGTSVLVAATVGRAVGATDASEMRRFMARELFEPLGMSSAQPEFAAGGEFVGGSFFYATARDWARFGYLYLRDGVWDGRRILPEGWVDFSRTPGTAANNRVHGAHFWVNAEPVEGRWRVMPGAPASAFAAEGDGYQTVMQVPTHDLVVVRLGEVHSYEYGELKALVGALVSRLRAADGAAP